MNVMYLYAFLPLKNVPVFLELATNICSPDSGPNGHFVFFNKPAGS